jgi:hypothetical protein
LARRLTIKTCADTGLIILDQIFKKFNVQQAFGIEGLKLEIADPVVLITTAVASGDFDRQVL